MRDRERLNALRTVKALSQALRSREEAALIAARAIEAQAHDARLTASARADAAMADWTDHLAHGDFAPDTSAALGRATLACVNTVALAQARYDAAADTSRTAEQRWTAQDARCRVGDTLVAGARRCVIRRHEERGLATGADRITSRWRAR